MSEMSSPYSQRAQELFARHLAMRDEGQESDLEALCAANPKQASELRALQAALDVLLRLRPQILSEGPLSRRLRKRFGPEVDSTLSLEAEPMPDAANSNRLFEKLRSDAERGTRYKVLGEIARGGMGAIWRIWDGELRRALAMKVVLGRGETAGSNAPDIPPRTLRRFLEEAQVTGQLDHPGIVPVHELGLSQDGHVYFTMRLVKGEDLRQIMGHVRTGHDGWSQVRALGVMLKVCEAMSYAHAKRVVHRDLKPANVMVGKFGEVYVMDWGLARVLGREDKHDLRIAPPQSAEPGAVQPEAREEVEDSSSSPLLTMDGDVVGTPSYMSPEQAKGQLVKLGAHSDVYAVGAMLYQLLGGEMPYVSREARVSPNKVLAAVMAGPPRPLDEIAPETPGELIAIVDKAMAREIDERYPTMQALAEDLRAYTEGRVVRAYETGAWADARKWVKRNRALAASLAAGIAVLVGGVITSLLYAGEAKDQAARADGKAHEAQVARSEAEQRSNDVLSLSASKDLERLVARAEKLWPADPRMIPELEAWLAEAGGLIEGRPADPLHGITGHASLERHKAKLAELRKRGTQQSDDGEAADNTPPDAAATDRRPWTFANPEDAWWEVQLSKLVIDLEALRDPVRGLMGDTLAEPFGWGVQKRLQFAKTIREQSIESKEAARRWSEAIAAIAASPKYNGLQLSPQQGLLPIGSDPHSGLWEFSHLQTGAIAQRGADGELVMNEDMGLVFVLIPGGNFWMGAQKDDPNGQNYDPDASANEAPVHQVEIAPCFVSKFEMTQGQWERFCAARPSKYGPDVKVKTHQRDLCNPVESVSWDECMQAMARMDLTLPSEAQWEFVCRGGTETPWWTGKERESLRGHINLADKSAKSAGAVWPTLDDWPELKDGWSAHAPVGSFAANAFGVHEAVGNVGEWCLDGYDAKYYAQSPKLDPICPPKSAKSRTMRGGSFRDAAASARSANRGSNSTEYRGYYLGLRPARPLER